MAKQLSPHFLEVNESTGRHGTVTGMPDTGAKRMINMFDVASSRPHNAQWTALSTKSSGEVFLNMPDADCRQMLASKGVMIGKTGK